MIKYIQGCYTGSKFTNTWLFFGEQSNKCYRKPRNKYMFWTAQEHAPSKKVQTTSDSLKRQLIFNRDSLKTTSDFFLNILLLIIFNLNLLFFAFFWSSFFFAFSNAKWSSKQETGRGSVPAGAGGEARWSCQRTWGQRWRESHEKHTKNSQVM